MVDVGDKGVTKREAVASGRIRMSADAFSQVLEGGLPTGDVFTVARLAGIQAAKATAGLIPLCHTLALSHVAVDVEPEAENRAFRVTATTRGTGTTGVEMEALTATAVALLTIYDMAKAVDRLMTIENIVLLEKRGGRSGDVTRPVSGEKTEAAARGGQ
ncbi:MAG: cyclic pyranopterin monophosphate synthase MoaC [Anaerolineae bacterium]